MPKLDHKWAQTIAGIISALFQIAGVIVALYTLTSAGSAEKGANAGASWTRAEVYCVIFLIVVIIITVGHLIFSRVRRKWYLAQQVIEQLSVLQGSYILTPQYVTAAEHGNHSKEGDLSEGGSADILTNSLKYDMFYSKAIATNIIRGAKYIYILPNTSPVVHDLLNYMTTIRGSIHEQLVALNVNTAVPILEELCKANLEFWFFSDENPCLYNFAIFRQLAGGGSQPFEQYWWYINPSDTDKDSHMLTFEIKENRDKRALNEIFEKLKKSSSKTCGHDVFSHRDNLGEWIGGGK